MSKPSYTTYPESGRGHPADPRAAEKGRDIMVGRDLLAHPDFAKRRRNFSDMPFPGCVGPLSYKDKARSSATSRTWSRQPRRNRPKRS